MNFPTGLFSTPARIRGRAALFAALVFGIWLGLIAGSFAAEVRHPNILFIISDDQRPDTIAALGNPIIQTPNLDRLVHGGTAFTRAVAAYPICYVSRAEILTSVCAFRNGVGYTGNKLDPKLATWSGTLRSAGYHTWFVGKWDNGATPKAYGYEETRGLYTGGGAPLQNTPSYVDHAGRPATGYRGYTFKTDDGKPLPELGVGLTPDISRHFADAAIDFIERKPAEPFFLHVAFTAPHDPRLLPPGWETKYDPKTMPLPKNFRSVHPFDHGNMGGRDEVLLASPRRPDEVRAELAAYYAAISGMDEQIGRIVEALKSTGQLDNTLIIFTSDQGLAVGSHGLIGKQNLYEHTLGVPLIMSGPGIPKGETREAQCDLRDLFPTTCEVTGIATPPAVQGRSLVPVLRDAQKTVYPFVVGYYTDAQRAIREGTWKLILYPKAKRTQLFYLASDPDEMHDLSAQPEQARRLADLRIKLLGWLKENGDPDVEAVAATPAPSSNP
ncbi:sulfatase [Chthoniobacter flavus Ellin428]|uniref:Sulfatase n=1 Tax=Chthoniobacter flavus Ellin428 TaxID=497964 RepID=B4D0V9_9BACT|nr:sulfatase-like hydrolase/transferase [Chthoniobacter flavus]EDY19971.1 sulfatase [Chthoniobacter flavus Ellin428]TCO91760.1 arylsulfatase A-like enzyme [Chthoniobacter flavus]